MSVIWRMRTGLDFVVARELSFLEVMCSWAQKLRTIQSHSSGSGKLNARENHLFPEVKLVRAHACHDVILE